MCSNKGKVLPEAERDRLAPPPLAGEHTPLLEAHAEDGQGDDLDKADQAQDYIKACEEA
jgi:hypothetical protein